MHNLIHFKAKNSIANLKKVVKKVQGYQFWSQAAPSLKQTKHFLICPENAKSK